MLKCMSDISDELMIMDLCGYFRAVKVIILLPKDATTLQHQLLLFLFFGSLCVVVMVLLLRNIKCSQKKKHSCNLNCVCSLKLHHLLVLFDMC